MIVRIIRDVLNAIDTKRPAETQAGNSMSPPHQHARDCV
jgi:hypothetical protein